jgi:antirestriction protein ArdC
LPRGQSGRITRPLRGNGIPYHGINVLMLWSAAMEKGYAAPVWLNFKQASELKANVRKGEHGSLVVYADKIIRAEADTVTGERAEREIPFMKSYTVFNVEHSTDCPSTSTPSPNHELTRCSGSTELRLSLRTRARPFGVAARWPIIL